MAQPTGQTNLIKNTEPTGAKQPISQSPLRTCDRTLDAKGKLSAQKRANATKDYLISKEVHEGQILSAVGLGENCPLYTTSYIRSLSTREERLEAHNKNRRSNFILEVLFKIGCILPLETGFHLL